MKRLIAIVASVLINAIALSVIAAGIEQSQTPAGKVDVTELTGQWALQAYVQPDVHSVVVQ